jgi:hypothetical protein
VIVVEWELNVKFAVKPDEVLQTRMNLGGGRSRSSFGGEVFEDLVVDGRLVAMPGILMA